MFNKNNIFLGIIIGICIPVVGYAVFMQIFDTLTSMGVMDEVTAGSSERRTRTLALLGICANIIPFEIYRKKRYDDTMRGLVFPTIIYIALWIFFYKDVLFAA